MRNRRALFRKKIHITSDEWERIKVESAAAEELMTEDKFAFFRNFLLKRKSSILETFAKDSIYDATTEESLPNQIIRKIFRPAKKEYSHLAGQYTLIEELFSMITLVKDTEQDVKKQQNIGVVELDEVKEEG